ncbi:depupylase/deamidase Dop [Alloscardovia venturai]|uniref:Depupylase/deamidase Dop n=1 Tax=Alloscardovia venturai TaxID=1769421 RepID=A0ABW2Y4X0_9BIFI
MTVRRVMGSETEYGIASRGGQWENHAQLSYDVIAAARKLNPGTAHIRWDYGHESPTHDARGFHTERAHVRSDLLTDIPQLQVTNVPHVNGGRVYVDHAHPEYSSPEVMSPREVITFDRAGDAEMREYAQTVSSQGRPITLYRNNTDGKGASWGSHENYQIRRGVPFDILSTIFTAHAVSRQIYTGTGRVGIGVTSEIPGFQLSQRADFFTMKVGLQTTFDRPIVNTRDEPHSTDAYRRFHVIVGDANRMDVPQFLKFGTTSLIFWALETSIERGLNVDDVVQSCSILDPVSALHAVSHDTSLHQSFELENGEKLTAFQLQLRLRSWVYAVAAEIYDTDIHGNPLWPDQDTKDTVMMWTDVLKDAAQISQASDDERLELTQPASRIEWFAKWQIMEKMRRRKGMTWNDAVLKAMDISWAQLDSSSLFDKVSHRTQHIVTSSEIAAATHNPPESTRAYVRGQLLKNYPDYVLAASWDRIALSRSKITADTNQKSEENEDGLSQREGSHDDFSHCNPLIIEMYDPRSYSACALESSFMQTHTIEEVVSRILSLQK